MKISEFNLFFFGDGKVGKTTFIKSFENSFEKRYSRTNEIEMHTMVFFTTQGKIQFNVYDTVGQAELLDDPQFKEAHCAIVMFDITRSNTYYNVPLWCSDVAEASNNENLPIVVVGNKCDLEDEREVDRERVKWDLPDVEYFDVSAKYPMRYGKYAAPFEYLARILLGDDQLKFVEEQVPPPPPVPVQVQESLEQMLEKDEDYAKEDVKSTTVMNLASIKMASSSSSTKASAVAVHSAAVDKEGGSSGALNTAAGEFVVHSKHTCDKCFQRPILGQRYTSAAPHSNFDLCARCYETHTGPEKKGLTETALVRDKKISQDFVLKLKIDHDGDAQVRRMKVAEIWDQCNLNLSVSKLLAVAVGFIDNAAAQCDALIAKAKVTYLDDDGDEVYISSDDEVKDAFLQVLALLPIRKAFLVSVTFPKAVKGGEC